MLDRSRCGLVLIQFGSFVFAAASAHSAAAGRVRFAVIGDYGVNSPGEAAVAAMIDQWNPDFIITTGDNNYGRLTPGNPDWELNIGQYFGRYMLGRSDERYPSQTSPTQRFFPTVGNHDTGVEFGDAPLPGAAAPGGVLETGPTGEREGYLDFFHYDPGNPAGRLPPGVHEPTESYYDVRIGPAHLFSIDAEAALFDANSLANQLAWLEAGLAASTAPWKFVYMHQPPYSSGPHGNHAELQWPYAAWGATAVFAGHDHTYERLLLDGFPYFVSGLGGQVIYSFRGEPVLGSQVRYNETFGAMRVTVDNHSTRFEFFAIPLFPEDAAEGRLIDSYVVGEPIPEPGGLLLAATLLTTAWVGISARRPRPGT